MNTALKVILLIGVIGYLTFAIIKVQQENTVEDVTCTQLDVEFLDSVEEDFIEVSYIENLLAKHKISPEGQRISQINLGTIEEVLAESPYVIQSNCYYTADGKLCIQVTPRQPVLHVIADDDEYFLDRMGECMPVGKFNPKLCVATGHVTRDFAHKQLTQLGIFIHDNKEWNELIEQIYVDRHNIISIYPKVGNQAIMLGDATNYQDKFSRLALFYQEGLPKVGWNRYKTINLAFDGQIVCTKADK